MSEQKKWTCLHCTYDNWLASIRCTICNNPKLAEYSTRSANSHGGSQDIYEMASKMRTSPTQPSTSLAIGCRPDVDPAMKWSCSTCTYLNWPKALQCTQCKTHRDAPSSNLKKTKEEDGDSVTQPLSINVNIGGASGGCSPQHVDSLRSHISPKQPGCSNNKAKKSNNERNRPKYSVVSAAAKGKWVCTACTYENWPKATKCILCNTSRAHIQRDITPPISDSETESHNRQQCSRSPESPDGASAAVPGYQARNLQKQRNEMDWLWLNACTGIIEGNARAVEAYLIRGGDPSRQISQEEAVLMSRPSAFQPGYTLIHLALRFKHEEILSVLLRARDVMSPKAKKVVPAHISPNTATDLLRQIAASLVQRKGDFPCYFTTELATFSLPADVDDLPESVQKQLFDELLDKDVQHELENIECAINWSMEITDRFGSKLYALWNRTCGNCLLDSALQATWGVFDRDNVMRRAVADSLVEAMTLFYPRWKEMESTQVQLLHITLEESQLQQDWATILSIASQPGASLEQIHIFALAHVLRRPIIVYGIKYVKNAQGENLGLARFQGVYLPLLWESSFCWKSPICLGYTRGHFSALVPMEVDSDDSFSLGAGAGKADDIGSDDEDTIAYLPLSDMEGKLLPVHFLVGSEVGREEALLKEWLDCWWTESGILVAQMKLHRQPVLVRVMLKEWLHRYKQLAHVKQPSANIAKNNKNSVVASRLSPTSHINNQPSPHHHHHQQQPDLSSDDGETDDE